MPDSKNLIIAVVLSVAILFAWQYFIVAPKVEKTRQEQALKQQNKESTKDVAVSNDADRNESLVKTIDEPAFSPRIAVESEKLKGSIALRGARFDDLVLLQYKETADEDSDPVTLLSPAENDQVYFAQFGWLAGKNIKVPDGNSVWKASKPSLGAGEELILSWDNGQGQKFFIDISLDENFMFTVNQRVKNNSGNTVSFYPYGVINRTKVENGQNFLILHEGPLGVLDEVLSEFTYEDLRDDKDIEFKSVKGWTGMSDKYWLTAIIPSGEGSVDVNYSYVYRNKQDRYQTDYMGQKQELSANKEWETTSYFYAGAKKVGLLDGYEEKLGVPLFDHAVDFGWLYFITKPIFTTLTYFNIVLGNFGLAILLLTVLIKIVLFPLANKSYVSMHHLKMIQPKIMKLREEYGHDKMQFNKEIMGLYKKEEVNPMAGCLPILIQIPIFFALYKVLFVTIEMRHAPFYGWISDLSAPDPTSIFNAFGLIPLDLPSFLMIGAWPLIMGLTMVVQQKLNPQPNDPVQAKVMKMLPVIFIFIFATFPAGLIIYWAWNNFLSIIQQWVITRRLPNK